MTLYLRMRALLWSAATSVGKRRSSSVIVAAMMSSSLRPIHSSAGANTSSSMLFSASAYSCAHTRGPSAHICLEMPAAQEKRMERRIGHHACMHACMHACSGSNCFSCLKGWLESRPSIMRCWFTAYAAHHNGTAALSHHALAHCMYFIRSQWTFRNSRMQESTVRNGTPCSRWTCQHRLKGDQSG